MPVVQSSCLVTAARVQSRLDLLAVMMLPTFPIALAAVVLACLSPEVASQQCRSGVTDEVRRSVREQLRQYQRRGENGTFPTVAVNCGQVHMSILSSCSAEKVKK